MGFEKYCNKREPDHKFIANITSKDTSVNDVSCELYLPERHTDEVLFIAYPTRSQLARLGFPFEFSFEGCVKNVSDEVIAKVNSHKVYAKESGTKHWGGGVEEGYLVGDPVNLVIEHPLKNEIDPAGMVFWLSPSYILNPSKMFSHSYTGEVKNEGGKQFSFTLENGMHLQFDHHYKFVNKDNNETVLFPQLVAECKTIKSQINVIDELKYIDDFLMIVSFVSRQRCACVGWLYYDSSKTIDFYRREISAPEDTDVSGKDSLVDRLHFEKFIDKAYPNYSRIKNKDYLKVAIYGLISSEESSVLEASFVSKYSSLENLVLWFRKQNNFEYVLDEEDWPELKEAIEVVIKKTTEISKVKRKLLYEKIPEINRISFREAFLSFCDFYSIEVDDLWPVVGGDGAISLSELRNLLVHGETFDQRQCKALVSAREHLNWVLERSILAILGWPYMKSKVGKGRHSVFMGSHERWESDRALLTQDFKRKDIKTREKTKGFDVPPI